MFKLFTTVLLCLILLALCSIICFFIIGLICTLLYFIRVIIGIVWTLINYFSIRYVKHHIDEIAKVNLFPSYQTYKRLDVPTGYSTDGLYRRWYYRYKYVPMGKERRAKVFFKNNRVITVFFKEKSPVYQQIMTRGVISQKSPLEP